uniref:Uncharacterized protein n=1 Tax=Arion vulgaris TaxID=1028688 RepID=A0A0B7APE2_9EUPU
MWNNERLDIRIRNNERVDIAVSSRSVWLIVVRLGKEELTCVMLLDLVSRL